MLTPDQRIALKTEITTSSDPQVIAARGGGAVGRNDTELARLYNLPTAKIVWRTDVERAQVYHATSGEGTTWNWTTYKAQDVREQNAWVQMFMGDQADFSLDNLRSGVVAIFAGSGAQQTQREHIFAIAKRAATRCEALFAIGTGTLAAPAKLAFQGSVSIDDIGRAMNG